MRKHIILLLILLITALPVWSAVLVCHHVQTQPMQTQMQMSDHHCCLDEQADTCHCDQLQHAQFILSLPTTVIAAPRSHFIPPTLSPQRLPKGTDVPYRPPIV
ncbi:MAG: hypothetical protein L3K52_15130 [Candidatus Thiothrix sulfatifontis]|nr:MAG: hypothetical protein L3K52_15130 [Candidatus Thiothrix sulfatifontis]